MMGGAPHSEFYSAQYECHRCGNIIGIPTQERELQRAEAKRGLAALAAIRDGDRDFPPPNDPAPRTKGYTMPEDEP